MERFYICPSVPSPSLSEIEMSLDFPFVLSRLPSTLFIPFKMKLKVLSLELIYARVSLKLSLSQHDSPSGPKAQIHIKRKLE